VGERSLFPNPLDRDEPTIVQADAVDWLKSLPPECAHLIVTDPAYESNEKHRAIGTTTRLKHSKGSSNDWFPIFPNDRFPDFFAQAFRVLVPNSHLYMMCDQETMFVVKPIAEAAGFRFWKAIIWDKVAIGMGYHYRSRHEVVCFFEKGYRKLSDLGVPDVLTFKRIQGKKAFPTEKPPELAEVLITQSSSPDEVVVDPFLGSGSTGVAALRNGRRFAGCDVDEKAIKLAGKRLEEERQ
jgi:site-specific DNA-methyltransferase (adenine-specific)